MKILCICEGGCNRSVLLARILNQRKHDTLACGTLFTKNETLEMLCNWAEMILIVQDDLINNIPLVFHSKVKLINIGKDIWYPRFHLELKQRIMTLMTGIDIPNMQGLTVDEFP